MLLQAIMFNAFASTISGTSVREGSADDLWDLVLHGIAARWPGRASGGRGMVRR